MDRLDLPRRFACWPLRTRTSAFAFVDDGIPFVENDRFRRLPQRALVLGEVAKLRPEVPVLALRLEGTSPVDALLEREPARGEVLIVAGVAAVASDHRLSNALFALRLRADALRLHAGYPALPELERLREARDEVTRVLASLSPRTAGSRSW